MKLKIWNWFIWLWNPNGEQAQCACIDLAWKMDERGLKDMEDFFHAMRTSDGRYGVSK